MKTKKASKGNISVFETIRKYDKNGHEYWSSKELCLLLGYSDFQQFLPVIEKAETACRNAGQKKELHFKEITAYGKSKSFASAKEDINLSRYACYLIIQNADPALKPVAAAQTYLAAQARYSELSAIQKQNSLRIVKKRRIFLRQQLAKYNLQLAGAARKAGIVKPKDFAIFQNHGYMGLYGGLDVKAIRELRDLDADENILDHMDSTELAANLSRVKQTAQILVNEKANDASQANSIHFAVGLKVRKAIQETADILPEDLPVTENIELAKGREAELSIRKTSKSRVDSKLRKNN